MRHVPHWVCPFQCESSKGDDVHSLTTKHGHFSQHDIVPPKNELQEISHVIIAFMRSEFFNVDDQPDEYPLFTSISDVWNRVPDHTKVMVAIGGWGDTQGFEEAAKSEFSRKRWARQVATMVVATGADGVDIDWEYPG